MSLAHGATVPGVDAEAIVTAGYADMLGRLRARSAVDEDWSAPVSYTHLTLPTNREV